jgi:hypothetical protein
VTADRAPGCLRGSPPGGSDHCRAPTLSAVCSARQHATRYGQISSGSGWLSGTASVPVGSVGQSYGQAADGPIGAAFDRRQSSRPRVSVGRQLRRAIV